MSFFKKKKNSSVSHVNNLIPVGPVVLTDEEREEAQHFIDSVSKCEGGAYYGSKEVVDVFQRGFIAETLEGRADRFKTAADSTNRNTMEKNVLMEMALSSSAKAVAIFPEEPLYLYRFGRLLEEAGKVEEARTVFQEYLRRQEAVPPEGPACKELVDAAVQYAKKRVSG